MKILKSHTSPYTDGDQDSHPYIRTLFQHTNFRPCTMTILFFCSAS